VNIPITYGRSNKSRVRVSDCRKNNRSEKIEIGHINTTYRIITDDEDDYVLQRINTGIFKDPYKLMENILAVTSFLAEKIKKNGGNPKRETLTLIETKKGGYLLEDKSGFYRMYYFIKDATSYNSVIRPILFYNAAAAFGKFQKCSATFPLPSSTRQSGTSTIRPADSETSALLWSGMRPAERIWLRKKLHL
jgi:hypothetical protein